jgi:hypothetical protein
MTRDLEPVGLLAEAVQNCRLRQVPSPFHRRQIGTWQRPRRLPLLAALRFLCETPFRASCVRGCIRRSSQILLSPGVSQQLSKSEFELHTHTVCTRGLAITLGPQLIALITRSADASSYRLRCAGRSARSDLRHRRRSLEM